MADDIARVPLVTGLVLGVMVAGLLVTSPAAFVGQGATFIDTTGWADEGGGATVKTNEYVRSSRDLHDLPESFDEWSMKADVSEEPGWRNVKSTFQADALVSRYYSQPGLYVPVHAFIVDSQFTRVLHSLPVSYGLQGFEQRTAETVRLNVTNATWLAEDSPNHQIPVVEGIFVKTNATTGEVEERRLVQYYWVKRQAWGVTDHLTWVGTIVRVPAEGNVSEHRGLLSDFTTDLTSQVFVPEASDVHDTVAQALLADRPVGPFLLTGSALVPVALVGYGAWGGPATRNPAPGGSPAGRDGVSSTLSSPSSSKPPRDSRERNEPEQARGGDR